jgi:hypothetical protein
MDVGWVIRDSVYSITKTKTILFLMKYVPNVQVQLLPFFALNVTSQVVGKAHSQFLQNIS